MALVALVALELELALVLGLELELAVQPRMTRLQTCPCPLSCTGCGVCTSRSPSRACWTHCLPVVPTPPPTRARSDTTRATTCLASR